MTITEIRERYPFPIAEGQRVHHNRPRATEYCVGGALCLAHGYALTDHFPDENELTRALRMINPTLDEESASDLASAIIDYNDDGQMDEAWALAEEALTTRGTP